MRHLLHISLLLVLLSVAVSGCRQTASEAERRLIALDSLIATAPDSALTQLSATDTATLSESERAYLALLLTQAMYKAYIPATSDTLIGRAWRYYEHSGPYDRRVRALLYQGTVAEELGRPEQAMRWYKQAEDYARPDDHYNHGYILYRQAALYQFLYTHTRLAIEKYKLSLSQFELCNNLKYQEKCLSNLGMLYRLINIDSVSVFIDQALDMSLEMGDTVEYYSNMEVLAGLYHKIKNWPLTKHYALAVVEHGMNEYLNSCYYYAAQSYLNLGESDSAHILFDMAPQPATVRDSILYFRTKSMLESHANDKNASQIDSEQADEIASNTILSAVKHDVQNEEHHVEQRKLKNEIHQLTNMNLLIGSVMAIMLFAVLFIAFYSYISYRNAKALLTRSNVRLAMVREQLEQALWQVEAKESLLQSAASAQLNEQESTICGETHDDQNDSTQVSESTGEATDESNEIQNRDSITTATKAESGEPLMLLKKCLTQLFNSVVYSGNKGASIFKYIFDIERSEKKMLVTIRLPESFWNDVNSFINSAYPGAMERIQAEGYKLNEKEKRLLYLDCLGIPNAAIGVALGYAERSVASVRFKLTTKLCCQGKSFSDFLLEKSEMSQKW